MKKVLCGILMVLLLCVVQAQDGIYGSFIVGQKIIDTKPLNNMLKSDVDGMRFAFDDFINNYWTFGGEGHLILAKHFSIGGKGFALGLEREATSTETGNDTTYDIKVVGGLGVGTLGYVFLAGAEQQVRLIPQVGLGVTSFLLQKKTEFNNGEDDFNNAFNDDKRSALTRVGFAVDLGLVFDWYIKFIELVKIIPGLGFGPLIHADIGYTLVPVNSEWTRDVNDAGSGTDPDLSLAGFYVNVGLGIGLSSSK